MVANIHGNLNKIQVAQRAAPETATQGPKYQKLTASILASASLTLGNVADSPHVEIAPLETGFELLNPETWAAPAEA